MADFEHRPRRVFWRAAALFILASVAAYANNIRVENAALAKKDTVAKTASVVFDLAWDNSWRDVVNHDAAWVFVKFRPPGSNVWEHAILSSSSGAHGPAANSVIDAVPDGGGALIYRSADYAGNVSYPKTRLCWEYGSNGYDFAQGDVIELAVFAIEMVYIPEGPFYVGSGGNEIYHLYKYTDGTQSNEPYYVSSEAAFGWGKNNGNIYYCSNAASTQTFPGGPDGTISNDFPKGFAAFYCMKHEVSQGQYTDFLNMLTTAQATRNFPNPSGDSRYPHTIVKNADQSYSVSMPTRAQNWLQVAFGNAYSDWAALRPMTELEYEKACRGPLTPVVDECAWGSTNYILLTSVAGVFGSGTETALPANANFSRVNYYPSRCGIFATGGTTTREASGAGYYGVLDLTGNVIEQCVQVGWPIGRAYTGLHGDGKLAANGDHNVPGWPGEDSGRGTIKRGGGGGGDCDFRFLRTSARGGFYSNGDRAFNSGWRAGRTAP